MNQPDTEARCRSQLPESLLHNDEPVFQEPWQAQAFALAVSLIQAGKISWQDWSRTLGEEVAGAADRGIAEDGSGYYELWLHALERLVDDTGLSTTAELAELTEAWRTAYQTTPHGEAVTIPE